MNPLLKVPGLGGYIAGTEMSQEQDARGLQQVGGVMKLQDAMRAQQDAMRARQMEQAFRRDIAALGPNPDQNALAVVAAKYAAPGEVLKTQQSSLDRQATTAATREATLARLTQTAQYQQQMHEYRMRQATTDEARAAELERHNKAAEETARELARIRGDMTANQPVTATLIVDPSDPAKVLNIDARTYKGGSIGSPGVLGYGIRESDTQKREAKRQFNMQGIGLTIQSAENILTGKHGAPLPTGSGFGTALDYAASLIGVSPEGAAQADQMRAIGGALTSKMPRMEGPQSDRDTLLYKEMAAQVGNSQIPVDRRLKALETVKDLWAKYEHLNPGVFAGSSQPQNGPKFEEGKVYVDAKGNKAKYVGGKFIPQ